MCVKPEQIMSIEERIVTLDLCKHTVIAVDTQGVVYVWGEESIYESDTWYNTVYIPTKVNLLGSVRIRSVVCGEGFFMALAYDGYHVFIWGKNMIYKPKNKSNSSSPVNRISGMRLGANRYIQKIICGERHAVMMLNNGEVWGLGDLYDGYDEFDTDSDDTDATILYSYLNNKPMQMLSDKKIVDIACGVRHTLYLDENGDVYISGFYTKKHQEFVYLIERNVSNIMCGLHSCVFVMENGEIRVMGENTDGELSCVPDHKPTIRSPKCVNFPI